MIPDIEGALARLVLVGSDAGQDDEVFLAALEGVDRRHLDPLIQRLRAATGM